MKSAQSEFQEGNEFLSMKDQEEQEPEEKSSRGKLDEYEQDDSPGHGKKRTHC